MFAVIDASPLEQFSAVPLPTGDACLLVIFGASGDLTRRKLIPGLYNLACAGCMNPQFEVLGVGRTEMSSEEFRSRMRESASQSSDARDFNESQWKNFERRLH
jgi:glucose-6-phosphate 1-dehydrogenase